MKVKRIEEGEGRFEIWVGPEDFKKFESALTPIERCTHVSLLPGHVNLWWPFIKTYIILDPEQFPLLKEESVESSEYEKKENYFGE